jgi:mono/diheme cytochrome c family protein
MATQHSETPTNGNGHGEGELYGFLAEYDTPGELVDAARKVRDAGYTEFDCYTPFPVHGIDTAMGIKRTILPLLVFGGGFTGAVGGLLLQWYCNAHSWGWNISGKPTWSIPANIPVAYECAILLSVFASFFGMWILNKLPQVWHPLFRSDRFARATDDGFFLAIDGRDRRFDAVKTRELLQGAGAIAIEDVHLDPDPEKKQMPKWITAFIVASTAFALIPFAIAAKARNSHSADPHIHIFPDMDFQPMYKSDTAMDLFEDGRANRGEIVGTVARGQLTDDDAFYRGLEHGEAGEKWITGFPAKYPDGRPFVVDFDPPQDGKDQNRNALLNRGRERFEIYCAPCHGYDGRGQGMVPERVKASGGVWQARNLVEAPQASGVGGVAVQMPNGQLFNTISNGYNTMMGYAAQIPHADRWAIVAYIRALQRAQNASLDDVPPDQRGSLR